MGEGRGLFRDRRTFSDVVELTSRVSTDKVAQARRLLESRFHETQRVDCAIATNMISVGLDIPRLGLMVVLNQPKTHAEYIQATSRVGRDEKRPGVGGHAAQRPQAARPFALRTLPTLSRDLLPLGRGVKCDAVLGDIHGEYDTDVERAEIALDPSWYPVIENRGEGVFVQLRSDAVDHWLQRPAVQRRLRELRAGHKAWTDSRNGQQPFPGGAYVLLHTLAHLLIQSLAMRCGYPASSLRERIYAENGRYGILVYTGTPDAEGTLGGLVQQGRHIEDYLAEALRMGQLCSNDPICAQHAPAESMRNAYLHGAACHGCTLIAETSCEMRNDYLDRALVVPVLGLDDAAFFAAPL